MSKAILPLATIATLSGLAGYWLYQNPLTSGAAPSDPLSSDPQVAELAEVEAISAGEEISDRLGHPPLRRTFSQGIYQLIISAENRWDTPLAKSELYQGGSLLWEKALPHQYGPRYALVSASGQTLLVDEFINVASPHALTLLDAEGTVTAQHSFRDIQEALGVSPTQLTEKATSGWWVSAPPSLNSTGDMALIKTGGTTLAIDLISGTLSQAADL